jgi:hypothetical protein
MTRTYKKNNIHLKANIYKINKKTSKTNKELYLENFINDDIEYKYLKYEYGKMIQFLKKKYIQLSEEIDFDKSILLNYYEKIFGSGCDCGMCKINYIRIQIKDIVTEKYPNFYKYNIDKNKLYMLYIK